MKGIILAGGKGTRLYPITTTISKQLLPVYDKPMIYYPLTTLMFAGIKEYLIICNEKDLDSYKNLLGNGSNWGLKIEYEIQPDPNGIPEALIIGETFLKQDDCVLVLGDNIFYGHNLASYLNMGVRNKQKNGAAVFTYRVNNPENFGVALIDKKNKITKIIEKPKSTKSNLAITGLYIYSNNAIKYAKSLTKSKRGELEITDLNNIYLKKNKLSSIHLGRGIAWLDTGTYESMMQASEFIRTIEQRQGLKIACPEEVAWRSKWISKKQLVKISRLYSNSTYGRYLQDIIDS